MYSGEWESTVLTKGGGMRINNLAPLAVQGKAIKEESCEPMSVEPFAMQDHG